MAEQQTPLINGFYHSWAQVEIVINGRRYLGVKSLNYTFTSAKTKVRGTAQLPIGRTTGQADITGDIELYMAQFNDICSVLGDDFTNAVFNIDIAYRCQPEDNMVSDELIGVAMAEITSGGADGNDTNTRKLKLDIMNAKFNGLWAVTPPDNAGASG
jgi:hypothetical protein